MHPFIRNDDILTLAPLQTHPRMGDVVAFIHPLSGNVIVHRVIKTSQTACLIQGDAMGAAKDGWVPFDQILGRVMRIHRDQKEIRFGLGPERLLIAFLSGRGWLLPLQSNPMLRAFGKWVLR